MLVHVAVGVLRDAAGRVLIARRHAAAHQGGRWEFPGGKVEPGESVLAALQREFVEELSIDVCAAEPLLQVSHDYIDKRVLLDVWLVAQFNGEPIGVEGQPLRWVPVRELGSYDFPDANHAIVDMLQRAPPDSIKPGSLVAER